MASSSGVIREHHHRLLGEDLPDLDFVDIMACGDHPDDDVAIRGDPKPARPLREFVPK
jgi:hypothetical protein